MKPLSVLMTSEVVPGPDDTIHLHEPKIHHATRQERLTPTKTQNLGGSAEDDDDDENRIGDGGADDDDEDQDGLPQPSIESLPIDPQTNVMDPRLAEDQLYIKIMYDFRKAPMISEEWQKPDDFPTEVLHFYRHRSLPDIFALLAKIVSLRLEDQQKECYDNLNEEDNERFLLVRPMLIHECQMKQRAFEFDDAGIPRIAVVNDLLTATVDNEAARRGEDPSEQTRQPQLTIELRFIDAVARGTITDPVVKIRSGAKTNNSGEGARFYRIGSQADPKAAEDRLVGLSDALFWRCGSGNDMTGPKIVTASMWSLRGLDICNPDEGRALGKDTPLLLGKTAEAPMDAGVFKSALDNELLHQHIKGRVLYNFRDGWVSWDSNPDILSRYPLTPLQKSEEPFSEDITVAVRYFSHLPFQETQQLELPVGEEIIFEPGDTDQCVPKKNREVFCDQIRRSLRKFKANALLFNGRHAKSWMIEIWVMAQVPEGKTLFRFAANDTLVDYLHEPFVAEGDTVLFAEVHLCPRASEKVTTKGGRSVQKK